nr:MAG TPA: ParB protein [Caudoviricetes sp.]
MNKSKSNINDSMFVSLPLSVIEPNDGQLDGLPANPRSITKEKLELLQQNIKEYPEMLSLRGLMVYPLMGGHYITVGGNMRLRALQSLGYTEAPCIVIPKETPMERLKAYSVIDNNSFGKWDWDMLANEWEESQLTDWGVDLPIFGDETKVNPNDYGDSFSLPDGDKKNVETITFTLSSEQAEFIKEQIKVSQYDEADTFGNTNKNGNALYAIVKQWADVRK